MSIFRLALGCAGSLAPLYVDALVRTETLVLLTKNLAPFNMAVDSGNYTKNDSINGVSAGTVHAACKRTQIKCQLILCFPWDRVYQQAPNEPDYGMFSTVRAPEREDKFKWVGPLAISDWVLMTRDDSNIHLNGLGDAARYHISGYKNDAINQHLIDRGLRVQLALRDNESVGKLVSRQIDLRITTNPNGYYVAQREGLREVKMVQCFHTTELFLALNKNTPDELVQKLQTTVDALRSEGLLKQTREHY